MYCSPNVSSNKFALPSSSSSFSLGCGFAKCGSGGGGARRRGRIQGGCSTGAHLCLGKVLGLVWTVGSRSEMGGTQIQTVEVERTGGHKFVN